GAPVSGLRRFLGYGLVRDHLVGLPLASGDGVPADGVGVRSFEGLRGELRTELVAIVLGKDFPVHARPPRPSVHRVPLRLGGAVAVPSLTSRA
ncbi:MAG: hypothetical protein ACO4BJ_10820, partial [Planctomycetota bacterium]